MNTEKQNKRIAVVGCGAEGFSKSTIAAIERAKAMGYEVVELDKDEIKDQGYTMQHLIQDETKKLDKECAKLAKQINYFKPPETRRERRQKARTKRKR